MKNLIIILFSVFCIKLSAQFTIVPTGTTKLLTTISVIGKNILISSPHQFMLQSYDECKTITQVYQPGPYWNWLLRKDSTTFYSFSSDIFAQHSILYKTYNGGKTWKTQLDTLNYFVEYPVFFDTLHGRIIGISTGGIQTFNGGKTWSTLVAFLTMTSCSKTYSDSTWAIGGMNGSSGTIRISDNRGRTWNNYSPNFGPNAEPTDIGFVNRDTIFVTSIVGQNQSNFGITYNGGQTWSYNSNIPSNHILNSTCIKSSNEYYIVGATSNNFGIVWKSNNFGKTWSSFNTNIQTILTQMAVLNDSIALLCGNNGVLLRWNYKATIFTGEDELNLENLVIKIYPNPVSDKLKIEFIKNEVPIENISILNALGATLLESKELKKEMDVSFLKPGLYFLKIESGLKQKTIKFIKE